MKYRVLIAGRSFDVQVDGDRVVLDGTPLEAHLAAVPGTPLVHLLLGNESWTVAAEPLASAGQWALGARGERAEVQVVGEQADASAAAAAPRASADAGGTLKAPMPGLVLRVEVAVGQRVEAGAGLVVVEAMKMENELRAPSAGVVRTVHVAAGQAVERGAPLVTLARPDESGPEVPDRSAGAGPLVRDASDVPADPNGAGAMDR
ncbi:MAG TPA: biotin/lipoyl-containing protein [Gemmatimonadales bacterium]|nr:biotin/lipoyl-containing protein [Gemmatimonadales bacterium]